MKSLIGRPNTHIRGQLCLLVPVLQDRSLERICVQLAMWTRVVTDHAFHGFDAYFCPAVAMGKFTLLFNVLLLSALNNSVIIFSK